MDKDKIKHILSSNEMIVAYLIISLSLVIGIVNPIFFGPQTGWSSVKKKDTLNIINLYSAKQHNFVHGHKVIPYYNGCESF